MTTEQQLQAVLAEKGKQFREDPQFVELEKFYEQMKALGLVKKQEYSIPLLDTIGRFAFVAEQSDQDSLQSR